MQEAGARRIKRSIHIDQTSVHFMTAEEQNKLKNFILLDQYLNTKSEELEKFNQQLQHHSQYNQRRLTNLGTFRAYLNFICNSIPVLPKFLVNGASVTTD